MRLNMTANEQTLPNTDRSRKKTYHQPELQVYGKLRDITQAVGTAGVLDNAGAGPGKTH